MTVAFCFVNGSDFLLREVAVIHLWLAVGADPLCMYKVNKLELRADNKLVRDRAFRLAAASDKLHVSKGRIIKLQYVLCCLIYRS